MNSSRAESWGAARDVSLDALLGGRVRLLQPKAGLRAAIDAVLLAASIPAKDGQTVLDVGCGSGAASLCLAVRVPGAHAVGLDLQADLVALACESAALNRVSDRVTFLAGDLLAAPPEIVGHSFDHVMANPPFARAGSGRVSPDAAKALASVEGNADLAAWVAFCAALAKPGGSVTFIHRADRAGEVADLFRANGLASVVLPLGPKRVLVQGRRTGAGSVTYMSGLDLHEADGRFTPQADKILRDGQALVLDLPDP
jgi:tRNA1(Val) A37 N6-methylase TrmN6